MQNILLNKNTSLNNVEDREIYSKTLDGFA